MFISIIGIFYFFSFFTVILCEIQYHNKNIQFNDEENNVRKLTYNKEDMKVYKLCPKRKYTDPRYGPVAQSWTEKFHPIKPQQGYTEDVCLSYISNNKQLWNELCMENKLKCECNSSNVGNNNQVISQIEKYQRKHSQLDEGLTLTWEEDSIQKKNALNDIKLFVSIGAHIMDEIDYILLLKLICSIREYHNNETMIYIYDNGSNMEYYYKILNLSKNDLNIFIERSEISKWEFGAIEASMTWLEQYNMKKLKHIDNQMDKKLSSSSSLLDDSHINNHKNNIQNQHFTHFAYFQHSMSLLKPLPLQNLGCPFVSFRKFGPGSQRKSTATFRHMLQWLEALELKNKIDPCRLYEINYFTYSVSFVSNIWAINKLYKDLKIFNKTLITDKNEDQLSERFIAVCAELFLNSSPETCHLDGDWEAIPQYVTKVTHELKVVNGIKYDDVDASILDGCNLKSELSSSTAVK